MIAAEVVSAQIRLFLWRQDHLGNIVQNPGVDKFRSIKLTNAAIQEPHSLSY